MSALVRTEPWSLFDLTPNFMRLDWNPSSLQAIRVEHYRDGNTVVIRAELPGIDPDKDVAITLENEVLHISAERTERHERTDDDGYRSEFRYGSFSRDIRVPAGVTESDITATYDDGVLEVHVPVPAEKAPTSIPVSRGAKKR